MIRVYVAKPIDPAWRQWQKDAEAESKHAKNAKGRKSYKVDADLYKRPRKYLLEAFADKCGYCETKIDAPDRFGDVDHFRPKGRVTNEDYSPVTIAGTGGKPHPHPGYYWLVYAWSNFIPSCPACNRPGEDRDGLKSGKWDVFPVGSVFRATEPGDEVKEKPLLINPREEDPNEHLVFDTQTGIIGFKTPRGETTIRLLGLNRRGLPEKRLEAYDLALGLWSKYEEALRLKDEALMKKLEIQRDNCRTGRVAYAAFSRLGIAEARAKNEERLKTLRRFLSSDG
jgi:hypothetical protein